MVGKTIILSETRDQRSSNCTTATKGERSRNKVGNTTAVQVSCFLMIGNGLEIFCFLDRDQRFEIMRRWVNRSFPHRFFFAHIYLRHYVLLTMSAIRGKSQPSHIGWGRWWYTCDKMSRRRFALRGGVFTWKDSRSYDRDKMPCDKLSHPASRDSTTATLRFAKNSSWHGDNYPI